MNNDLLKIKIAYIGTFILFLTLLTGGIVDAQQLTDYSVLAPLPGIGDTGAGTSNLNSYLPAAFRLTVGIAIALAFIFITIGGITYATSDSLTGKQDGRNYIENAILGLLLVIGSYVILYTINPQILNLSIVIPRPNPPAQQVTLTSGTPLTQPQLADDQTIRQRLAGSQITVNANPCANGQTRGCTNLNGLPENAITGLTALRNACNCPLVITGGTEGGHSSHKPGVPIVDLRPSAGLNRYILNSVNNPSDKYTRSMSLPNGQSIRFTYETLGGNAAGTSTGDHWHVVIQ